MSNLTIPWEPGVGMMRLMRRLWRSLARPALVALLVLAWQEVRKPEPRAP